MSDNDSTDDSKSHAVQYPLVGGDLPPPPPPPPPPPHSATSGMRAKSNDSKNKTMNKGSEDNGNSPSPKGKEGGLLGEIESFKKDKALKKVTPDMISKPKEENKSPGNAAELLAQFMDERVRNIMRTLVK